ncbi:MAG: uroporphyrinogen-III synthase [Proteobacteria bacterium]|nr:uroporphyrinogen-III synthase [Pseudomonadota bacterium]
MHILVTRPEPDSLKLVGLLEERGHEALAAPLMMFEPLGLDPDALEGVTGLIATSRNALRALVGSDVLDAMKGLTVFAVGAGTAEEARRLGFARVVKGPGTAAGLGPLIASLIDPAEEVLLHLAGERVAHDLAGELEQAGIRATSATVYRMRPAAALPGPALLALKQGMIDAVMLMSPDVATVWVRLVARHGLEAQAHGIVHLCLSAAVARRLAPLEGIEVGIADRPSLEEMLALADATQANME